jgi:hypothetical protein
MFSFCVEYIQWITLRRNYVVRCNDVQFLCRIFSVAWIDSNHVQFSECHDLFSYLDRQYAETNILSLVPFFVGWQVSLV